MEPAGAKGWGMLRFHGLNTGWLLVPILVWNLAFTRRLPQEIFHSDAPQAPALSPALWLLGIALLGRSWWYGLLSLAFVAVHVYHNIILIIVRK